MSDAEKETRVPSEASEPARLTSFVEFVINTYRMNWFRLSYQQQEAFLSWAVNHMNPPSEVAQKAPTEIH